MEGLQVRASLDFSRQNGIMCKLSNVITSSSRQSRKQCFTNSSGAQFMYFLIQNNVQTARESPDSSLVYLKLCLSDLNLYIPSTIVH